MVHPEGRSAQHHTDTNHRRERGRVAQAAFRKRQIDTIHVQEEQLRSFDQLWKDVIEATSKLKNAIQVSANLGKDDVSGYMVNEVVNQLDHAVQRVSQTRILKSNGKDNKGISNNLEALIHQEVSSRTPLSFEKVVTPEVTTTSIGGVSPQNNYTHEQRISQVTQTIPDSNPLILSHLVPPVEIIPYLSPQPGSKPTFASKLYWGTMSLGYRLASGAEKPQSAPRMLLYHLRFHTAASIAGRIGRMLLNESTGVIFQDSAPHFTYQMSQHIIRDLVLEGEDVMRYLDAREVELYFWRRGFNPILLGAAGVLNADWRLGELLQELSRNSVCFGDGPRYPVDDVERAFLNATGGMSIFPFLNF